MTVLRCGLARSCRACVAARYDAGAAWGQDMEVLARGGRGVGVLNVTTAEQDDWRVDPSEEGKRGRIVDVEDDAMSYIVGCATVAGSRRTCETSLL
jgi:hypothetical protein